MTRMLVGVRNAFTLVETLVALGVLALSAALILPSLASARHNARRTACVSQSRQHHTVIEAYAVDSDGELPFGWRTVRRPPDLPYEPPSGSADWYLGAAGIWQVRVLDAFGGDPLHESLFCPANRDARDDRIATAEALKISRADVRATLDYRLSESLLLDPRALDPVSPSLDVRYYVPRRLDEVVFPASKGFLFCIGPFHDPQWLRTGLDSVPFEQVMGFADGSTLWLNTRDLMKGLVMTPSGDLHRDTLAAEANKLRFTPWGVRGRDRQ